MIARESSLRQSSFIRPRARVHAAVTAAPILIRRLARPRARIRRPAPNPILSWGDRDPVAIRRPPARRAPRRPPPARSTDASLAIRTPRFARSRASRASSRVASRVVHPSSIASRSRRASPNHPPRTATDRTPSRRRTARAPRWIFASRAARATTRGRATLESVCAIIVPRRGVPSSTPRARRARRDFSRRSISRHAPRSRDAFEPIETSRSSSPLRVIVRCVI